MPTKIKKLPSVKDCIAYIEGLGYKSLTHKRGIYSFECLDKSRRPQHNWIMSWSLTEMRHAKKYGC